MNLRNRLLPVGALVVALGASAAGAAAAADIGKGTPPKPNPAPGQTIVKCEGSTPGDKDKGGPAQKKTEPDWAAIAGKLGVTEKQLQDALAATKLWIRDQAHPAPDLFIQHVADLLHRPVAEVKTVLTDAGVFSDDEGKDKAPGKTPDGSADKAAAAK
ncbi:hypothetical protein [Catenulispora subtropica]